MSDNPWHKTSFTRLMLDGHRGDYDPRFLSKLDIDKIVDQAVRTEPDVVTVMGMDIAGYAWWNTRIGHKCPALGEIDYLGEMVEKLHAKGIKVMILYVTLVNRRLFTLHPEWRQISPEGQTVGLVGQDIRDTSNLDKWPGVTGPDKFLHVCPNSPARQVIIDEMQEVIANYGIDGIWMDMPVFVTECHCKYCKEKYKERFGSEIPLPGSDSPLRNPYIKWKSECIIDYSREVWEAAKSVRSNIIFKKNFIFSYQAGGSGETIDSGNIQDSALSDIYPTKGALSNSIRIRFLKATSRTGLGEALYYRQSPYFLSYTGAVTYYTSTKSQSQMLTEAFTTIANGCAFSIGDFMHAEGYFYDEIIDRFSEVLKQVNNRKEWLIGAETVKHAGLYFSQDTRDMYGNNLPHRFGDHFTGTAKMLIEEHIPFEIAHHKNLATVSGEGLKVLVMPNAACLNETQAEEIRKFVKQGGGLVATYETSLYDENGKFREDFLLCDLFGASYCGNTGFYSDFLEMGKEHPVTSGLSREIPLQHQGSQLKVRTKPGAEVLARVVTPYWKDDPFHYVQLLQPPGIHTELPAVITHKYGEGRVVYLPNRTDAVYAALNIPEARRLLANAVRWAAGEEILEIEAPSCIETTLFVQEAEGRTIVHLVNTQPTEETIPVTDITARIRINKPITKVYLAPDRTKLDYTIEGDIAEVHVPKVEYHNMIVFE